MQEFHRTDAIDKAILSVTDDRWRKLAMVVGKAGEALKEQSIHVKLKLIKKRIQVLADCGRLQATGNLSLWRHSEVRLPPDAQ